MPPIGQHELPFFPESETAEAPAEASPAPATSATPEASSTFLDNEGRFVPKCCECGGYASFGVGVSLRKDKEGTWWCSECWRSLGQGGTAPQRK